MKCSRPRPIPRARKDVAESRPLAEKVGVRHVLAPPPSYDRIGVLDLLLKARPPFVDGALRRSRILIRDIRRLVRPVIGPVRVSRQALQRGVDRAQRRTPPLLRAYVSQERLITIRAAEAVGEKAPLSVIAARQIAKLRGLP